MALSLNEIKIRAQQFVLNWKDKAATAREEADAQTFENEFFAIFGVPRSKIAVFEHKVKLLDGSNGYIDLFWKGYILIEENEYLTDADDVDAYRMRAAQKRLPLFCADCV